MSPISRNACGMPPARWGDSTRPSSARARSSGGHRLLRPDVDRGEEPAGRDALEHGVEVEHGGPADQHEAGAVGQQVELARPEQPLALGGDGRQHEHDLALAPAPRPAAPGRARPRAASTPGATGRRPGSWRRTGAAAGAGRGRGCRSRPARCRTPRSRIASALPAATYRSRPARKARSSRLIPRARSIARPSANSATAWA